MAYCGPGRIPHWSGTRLTFRSASRANRPSRRAAGGARGPSLGDEITVTHPTLRSFTPLTNPASNSTASSSTHSSSMTAKQLRIPPGMSDFIHSYPKLRPSSHNSDSVNLAFYQNRGPATPSPWHIDELHSRLSGNYAELEGRHDFIQWVFPSKSLCGGIVGVGLSAQGSRLTLPVAVCARSPGKGSQLALTTARGQRDRRDQG